MTVKSLLPSEILITLKVLSVRSAIALPLHFKVPLGNDILVFYSPIFIFLTCSPRK